MAGFGAGPGFYFAVYFSHIKDRVLKLCFRRCNCVITEGNQNAVTDGVVAVLASRTAALAALYNVKINLSAIKDPDFVKELTREIENLDNQVIEKENEILAQVII